MLESSRPPKILYNALFLANPFSEPPFSIQLMVGNETIEIADNAHIPAAIEAIEQFCESSEILVNEAFTLLYPIYMEAMNTDAEGTMHQIAWLIKEAADKHKWNFNRTGGLTNKTAEDFK